MTIYDDYISYHEKYTAEYGEKTIVFLQVGDFFEMYGVQNEQEQAGPDMYAIGDIGGFVITRKNKSIPENSRANPLMAGFPIHAFQKQAQLFVQLNYTIVVIRQVTPPPNVQRKVTEIISPSTFISQQSASTTSYLMAFLWEDKNVGIAGVDLTTGHTWVYEVVTSKTDALEESYRLLQIYTPKELILAGNVSAKQQSQIEEVIVGQHPCVHVQWNQRIQYPIPIQNHVLRKAFPQDSLGLLSPIEQLDLEKLDLARTCFVHLLQFAYQHNDRIIEYLQKPQILLPEKYLTLEYNSSVQLNLISQNTGYEKSLLDILNRTSTSLGSRRFREWLLQPLTEPSLIQQRYDEIQRKIQDKAYDSIIPYLRKVVDLERAVRRMVLKTFAPMDWVAIATTLEAAEYVLKNPQDQSVIHSLKSSYQKQLVIDECAKYGVADIRSNIFQKGIHPDLDDAMASLRLHFEFFDRCIQEIGKDLCRLESNERDGYSLCITKKRWDTYHNDKTKIKTAICLPMEEVVAKPISHTSSVVRLHHPKIEAASQAIQEVQRKLSIDACQYYQEFVQTFLETHQQELMILAHRLAEIDVICTCAKNAVEYDYCRPHLTEDESESIQGSWFNVQGLRHPIIERLPSQVAYVANDIAMGSSGLLLYGVNSSGKSSFMKAIGLNVIMAQAGMYVAASEFTYSPYRHVFTRIASTDNLYRGMSSFVVEMTELRTILYRANAYSLVLGDELCAGTESVSALSIVAAGVEALLEQKATFVFATHLHELTDYLPDSDPSRLRIAHMHIEMEDGNIVYQRLLREGKGSPLYGLEVCHALGMPSTFLKQAQAVRRKMMNVPTDLIPSKTSRYNRKVVVDMCGLCRERPATETHHILHQEDANEEGFVQQGLSVHHPSNLIPLCEECHLKQHSDQLGCPKYVQTTKGVQVVTIVKDDHIATTSRTSPDWERMQQYIGYFPMMGWKKKTIKGVWRGVSWERVQKELGTEIPELDAQNMLRIQ